MTRKLPGDTNNGRQVVAGVTTYAAAALLFVAAVSTIAQGIAALVDERIFVVTRNYVFQFNMTVWGCVHLIVGIAAAAVAAGLFWNKTWARFAAVTIASFSIISMFFWLSHSPLWSALTIVFDICVIWAILTWKGPALDSVRGQHQG